MEEHGRIYFIQVCIFLEILWEFSIFKVSCLFTLLKSADILHSFENSADNKNLFAYGRFLLVCQDFGVKERKEGRRKKT